MNELARVPVVEAVMAKHRTDDLPIEIKAG
jgi:hypothetical protein